MNFVARWFDIFAAPLFKTDHEGRDVFFPWGVWGAGYILEDRRAADRLRKLVRGTWMAFFFIGIPILTQFVHVGTGRQLVVAGIVGAGFGLGASAWFKWQVRGRPRSDLRMSLREAQDAQTLAMGRGGLLIMLTLSLLLIALGVMAIAVGGRDGTWIGGLLIAMFGGCLGVFFWQWRRLGRLEN